MPLILVPFTFKSISEVSLMYRIRCIGALVLFGIVTTELVHSKDGYMTYDDYKLVADPGKGPGEPGPPPLFLTKRRSDRPKKKISHGLNDRASPLSGGLHASVTAYQPS